MRGFPHWAVSIARTRGGLLGEIEAGVVWDPVKNDLFTAELGSGAFRNGHRLRVPPRPGLAGAALATGFPFRQAHKIDRYLAIFRELFLKVRSMRRAGSAALDLAYVGAGIFDGFFEFGLSPVGHGGGRARRDGGRRPRLGLRGWGGLAHAREPARGDARAFTRPSSRPCARWESKKEIYEGAEVPARVVRRPGRDAGGEPVARPDWFDAFRGKAYLQGDASFVAREKSAAPDSPPLFRARWVVLRYAGFTEREREFWPYRNLLLVTMPSGARYVLESSFGFVDESHLDEERPWQRVASERAAFEVWASGTAGEATADPAGPCDGMRYQVRAPGGTLPFFMEDLGSRTMRTNLTEITPPRSPRRKGDELESSCICRGTAVLRLRLDTGA